MDRRWLASTAVLCFLLVAVSFAFSGRSGKMVAIVERDGERTIHRRKLGLFSSNEIVRDPSLRVSDEFRKRFARAGFKKLSPELERTIDRASRSRQDTILQDFYTLSGDVAGTPKAAVDFYARQAKGYARLSRSGIEQLYGTASDGRTQVNVNSYDAGGRTIVSIDLIVSR